MATSAIEKVSSENTCSIQPLIQGLRLLAIRALNRMYRPEDRLFAFHIRRTRWGNVLEGISRRYTAIALMGLVGEGEETASRVLAGQSIHDVCWSLIQSVQGTKDLGEAALCVWIARMIDHRNADQALRNLQAMDPVNCDCPTVELAWCLSALTVEGGSVGDDGLAKRIARRLMNSYQEPSCLFPHRPEGSSRSFWRGHVGCFADQVYPIQALSFYYLKTDEQEALVQAQACANQICEAQGTDGQWWWHYDVRTGRVIEGYPVYAVHQDGMAPMALFALQKASGKNYWPSIERGMAWLAEPPERRVCLIDGHADLVWRKIARWEPGRWSRGLQALASRVHPRVRVPGLNLIFRPVAVDYESRPYHMGWLLYAWSQYMGHVQGG